MRTLGRLRERIDRVDLQLLRLLNRRAAAAVRIGQLKRKEGLPVYDGRREERLLRRLLRSNQGPLPSASVRGIFRQILRHSRQLQGRAGLLKKERIR